MMKLSCVDKRLKLLALRFYFILFYLFCYSYSVLIINFKDVYLNSLFEYVILIKLIEINN